jgi:hypothetical protein
VVAWLILTYTFKNKTGCKDMEMRESISIKTLYKRSYFFIQKKNNSGGKRKKIA